MDKLYKNERRDFFSKVVKGIGYSLFGGMVWSAYIEKSKANTLILRPPGAIKEEEFISKCIKCGLCVEACPFNTLQLANISDGVPLGTPFMIPREIPCYMCLDIPCANNCPTEALDITKLKKNNKLDINKATIGTAIINQDTCIAFWGLQCTICVKHCPIANEAIKVVYEKSKKKDSYHAIAKPLVNSEACTGCGLCEKACPTEVASIYILPREIATAKNSKHYIKSWKEEDEQRLKNIKKNDFTLPKTKRNEKSLLDNVNDVEGILDD
ncbi:MAG: ferredoxin-type protein NapG [Arcobacter sp.]|nr:ferredoxin-type protein NapG [Arcobacter sp.]